MMNVNNPFPGLRSFDFEESHLFFGREKHISDLLKKLKSNHFVAIVGTSGSGKSSLVRAGLLPEIQNGNFSIDGSKWLITTLKPGNAPVRNLARSLIHKDVFGTGDTMRDEEQLRQTEKLLRASRLGLVQAVRGMLPPNNNLLILLDQFEETFRFTGEGMEHNDEDSTQFVNLVVDAVRQRDVPIYVVLTIRSDFLGDCARFEGLPEAINDGHYLVPRLTNEQNKSVITGPVNYAQGKISPRLIQRVINDLGDNPDQLPVLQHALMRTWDVWKSSAETGEPMDIRHYETIGGMDHALSNHADEAYNELDERHKNLVEQIFKCLTVKTGENRGVRRPTSIKNLMEITGASFSEVEKALHPFRKTGRTFILPAEGIAIDEKTVMDISHESLMRAWERLRNWVDEEAESATIYQRLCQSAVLHDEGKAALWRNPELQMALDWKNKTNPNAPWARQYNVQFDRAMEFIEDSRREDAAERQRLNSRKRAVRIAVSAFLIVVTVLSAWALLQTQEAKKQTTLADKNRIEAEQKALEAINQKQLAEKAKEVALDASKKALDAKSYAELQSRIAGEQKILAEQQKSKAEQEATRASQQQQLAERKSAEALREKQKADSANAEKERLRMISVSQNIAFKSLQEKNDAQLSGLLALQAFRFSNDNGGNINDAQLYNALSSSAQRMDVPFNSVAIKNSEEISALSVNEKGITTVTQSSQLKIYDKSFSVSGQSKLNGMTSATNTTYLSGNGKYVAIGLDNNSVAVFNVENPDHPNNLTGHTGLIRAVAFSDDGNTIATGGRDSTIIIWKNFTLSKKIKCSSRVRAIAFTDNNSNIYAGSEDGKVISIDVNSGESQPLNSINARVQSMKVNGRYVAIGYSNGTVQLISNKQVVRNFSEGASADYLGLDEKSDLLVVGLSNKLIHVYHISEAGKPIEINCNSVINTMDVSGDFIYAACADHSIRSYPVKTSYFEKVLSKNIKRSLTKQEWEAYIGTDIQYEKQ
jgi:energy-coupling factor transporter ATP-binding protein EcfA2